MRVIIVLAVFAVVLAIPAGGARAADQSRCAMIGDSIDHFDKALSMLLAQGIGENSAPRETARALDGVKTLLLIQINMDLLRQLHCPQIPEGPIKEGTYLTDAMSCEKAVAAAVRAGRSGLGLPACDEKSWRPKR